jgi:hypothetical protein
VGSENARESRSGLRRIVRGLLLVAVGVLVVVAWILAPDYLELAWGRLPHEFQRRAAFLYLDALLIGYAIALAVAIGLIGGVLVTRKRSRPDATGRRRRQVRLLAPGISILLNLLALDVGAAAWSAWRQRMPRLPELVFRPGPAGPNGAMGEPVPLPSGPSPTLPSRFPATGAGEAPGALRLLVIGESSGRGEPYHPWLSVGQIAAWKLESVFPGRPVHLDIWATGGATLREMHNRLAGLTYRPDALIVYVGHNEFQARFSWQREPGGYYDDDMPSLYSPPALTAVLRFSPLCRLVLETWERQRIDLRPPRYVTRELVDQPVCTPEEYEAILADFRRRLEEIAAYCDEIGTLPVYIIPACNDGGYDPSRSVLAPETPRAERAAFAREVARARDLEERDPAEALRVDRELVTRHPEFAETHYRLARLLEQAGDWDEARRHYILARERDGLPLRCPEDFRRAFREVAARHPAVLLVDSPVVLEAASAHGILDDRLFHDAQHPNLRGYAALAQDLLVRLRGRRAFSWPDGVEASHVEADACARHFGIDAGRWAEVCRRESKFYDITAYIRYDPTFRLERSDAYKHAAEEIQAGRDPTEAGIPGWSARPSPSSSSRPSRKPTDRPAGREPVQSDGSRDSSGCGPVRSLRRLGRRFGRGRLPEEGVGLELQLLDRLQVIEDGRGFLAADLRMEVEGEPVRPPCVDQGGLEGEERLHGV